METREYEILAAANVTPESPMSVVRDAGYTITADQRTAWDRLRIAETRLVIDFLTVALRRPTRSDP